MIRKAGLLLFFLVFAWLALLLLPDVTPDIFMPRAFAVGNMMRATGGDGSDSECGLSVPAGDGVNTLTAGALVYEKRVTFNCYPTGWEMVGDAACSAALDVLQDTYANYSASEPSDADTIAGTHPPTLTTQIKNTDTSLGTGTPFGTLTKGNWLRFKVKASPTPTCKKIIVELFGTR